MVGLCYVAVTSLPRSPLGARVQRPGRRLGAATLVSPLIGGLLAEAGFWRGAFWLFAIQGAAFVVAGLVLVKQQRQAGRHGDAQRATLRPGAGVDRGRRRHRGDRSLAEATEAAISALAGLGLFAVFLRLDRAAPSHLLPREAGDPCTAAGAGLPWIFSLQGATVAFSVYGSALLQSLHHARPILAGYILAARRSTWTIASFIVASQKTDRLFIRLGAGAGLLALASPAFLVPHASLIAITAAVMVMGAGFGMAWSFTTARIVANSPPDEQAFASLLHPDGPDDRRARRSARRRPAPSPT